MGRVRSWWNGSIKHVGWSPWHVTKVVSVTVEVNSGGATPPGQRGRVIHCAMTPERARVLALLLMKYAMEAEAEQRRLLGGADPD
jgi:hypothetical protein